MNDSAALWQGVRAPWWRTMPFLWNDAILRYWKECIPIVLLGFLAPLVQVGLFSFLLLIISSGGHEMNKVVLGHEIHFQVTHATVRGIGIMIPLLLMVTFLAIYWSNREAEKLARRHQAFCQARFFAALAGAPVASIPGETAAVQKMNIRRAGRSDSIVSGRIMIRVLGFPVPFFSLVGYFGMLVWINPWLTLVFLILCPALAIFQMRLIKSSSSLSRNMEFLSVEAAREMNGMTQALLQRNVAIRGGVAQWKRILCEETSEGRRLDAMMDLRLLTSRTQVTNDLLGALAIGLVIIGFSIEMAMTGRNWAEIIAYLVILKMISTYARSLAGTAAMINRYLPQVGRYRAVLDQLEQAPPVPPASSAWRGVRLAACADIVSRLNARGFLEALDGPGCPVGKGSPAIVQAGATGPLRMSWGEFLGVPDPAQWEGLRGEAEALCGIAGLPWKFPADPDLPLDPKLWNGADPVQQVCCLAAGALVRGQSPLILNADDFTDLDPKRAEDLLAALAARAGILLHMAPGFRAIRVFPQLDLEVILQGRIERVIPAGERSANVAEVLAWLKANFRKGDAEAAAGLELDEELEAET
jgi:hypothetical protein